MQFYLASFDDIVRISEENPSIGIIISPAVLGFVLFWKVKTLGGGGYFWFLDCAKASNRIAVA